MFLRRKHWNVAIGRWSGRLADVFGAIVAIATHPIAPRPDGPLVRQHAKRQQPSLDLGDSNASLDLGGAQDDGFG